MSDICCFEVVSQCIFNKVCFRIWLWESLLFARAATLDDSRPAMSSILVNPELVADETRICGCCDVMPFHDSISWCRRLGSAIVTQSEIRSLKGLRCRMQSDTNSLGATLRLDRLQNFEPKWSWVFEWLKSCWALKHWIFWSSHGMLIACRLTENAVSFRCKHEQENRGGICGYHSIWLMLFVGATCLDIGSGRGCVKSVGPFVKWRATAVRSVVFVVAIAVTFISSSELGLEWWP